MGFPIDGVRVKPVPQSTSPKADQWVNLTFSTKNHDKIYQKCSRRFFLLHSIGKIEAFQYTICTWFNPFYETHSQIKCIITPTVLLSFFKNSNQTLLKVRRTFTLHLNEVHSVHRSHCIKNDLTLDFSVYFLCHLVCDLGPINERKPFRLFWYACA